jgi:Ser/Thr protein kinase RdoA (MazF antagonist)
MKLNNVLFDKSGAKAVCLLDLDTCMGSTVTYDFGDLVRNTAVPCAEDEQDFSKVVFDMNLYRAICQGYMTEIGGELTKAEIELLPTAPRVLALILGVRFLTDYLLGDTYFRVHRNKQNYERARTQFQIVSVMERLESEMRAGLLGRP